MRGRSQGGPGGGGGGRAGGRSGSASGRGPGALPSWPERDGRVAPDALLCTLSYQVLSTGLGALHTLAKVDP